MIRIALAEDQPISLKALESKLLTFHQCQIVHKAKHGGHLLELLQQNNQVDIVLMDIEMPELDGIQTTKLLKEIYPSMKVVMITIYDDDEHIFNAIKAGADSYILKDTSAEKIFSTIEDTMNGGAVMSPSIALKTLSLLKNYVPPKEFVTNTSVILSEREIEILEKISKGFTNKRIAEQMFISPFTVKRHIENIYKKLQSHNRVELIENARNRGLI
jgi:DNA-binding NarL/FixJ family response regulator